MKRILLIMVAFLAAATTAHAYKDHDFQIWNSETEEFKLNKDTKLSFEEEFRWGDNAGEFYYQHYDVGVFYNLNKSFNFGGGYRHIYELKKGKFKPENAPFVTATLFWELKGFKFDDRSRMEYRHFDYQADSWRYRNKITMKLPFRFTGLKFQPYISDELLVGFGKIKELNQNRFACGLGMDLTKNIKGDIYYMLVSTKSSGFWVDSNVLGTKIKLSF